MAEKSRKRGPERRPARKVKRRPAAPSDRLPFERQNWMLFGAALGVIVLGYIFLATGSITLAPLLLVMGYCVLVPLAIIYKPRQKPEAASADTGE